MDRAFDVWNLKNEQYYWELNYALQKQDLSLLENILEKYFVEFIIFDDNIIFPGEKIYAKQAVKTKELLDKSGKLQKIAQFGKITVYHTTFQTKPIILNHLPSSPGFKFSHFDPAFLNFTHYFVNPSNPTFFYPFADLFTNRLQDELSFQVKENLDSWEIEKNIPFSMENYQLVESPEVNPALSAPLYPNFESLLPSTPSQEIKIPPEALIKPRHCAPQSPDGWIKFARKKDAVVLKTKDAALCVDWQNYEFFKKIKEPVVVEVEFEYLSSSDEWPQFCLWNKAKQRCLNRKEFPFLGFSHQWQKYAEKIFFNPKEERIDNLAIILDGYRQKEEKQISYRNIKLKIYPAQNLSSPFYIKLTSRVKKGNKKLIVEIPKIRSPWFIDNPIQKNLFKLKPKSCNPTFKNGWYNLEPLEEGGKKFIRLSATNNDSCSSWYFPELPLSLGWLVEIEYRHVKGYPLLVSSFGGEGKYKFFYTKLEKVKDWKKAYFVIPAVSQFEKGITLTFSNSSFNQKETVNDISSLRIIPLNWDYLTSLRIQKNGSFPLVSQTTSTQAKGNIWYYTVAFNPQVEKKNYLVLPQSYDQGWVAVKFEGVRPQLLKNHVLVNNWANGWEIDSSKIKGKQLKVYLLFLPNLLEIGGIILLVGLIAAVLYSPEKFFRNEKQGKNLVK